MKNSEKIRTFIGIAIVCIWGLAPLLWFRDSMVITSDDMRLPLTIEQYKLLFYSWNHLFNTGINYTVGHSAIIFYSLQALLRFFNLSTLAIQKIQFVFWFMLSGLSMYFMVHQIFKGRDRFIASLVASNVYMFNLYLAPVWLGFNIANISVYAILPALIAVFNNALERKISYMSSACIIAVLSLLASAVGANPPMALIVLPVFPLFFMLYLIKHRKSITKCQLRSYLLYILLIVVVVFLVNSFWVVPRIAEAFFSVSKSGYSFITKEESKSWLMGISANTSFINVIRLQGIWTWHQGWKEPYCPYAVVFRENPFFITISWLLPLLVLVGAIVSKSKHKAFFAVITLVGIIFSMGAHWPFSRTYLWMVEHVPLFWIIRSPWYKFNQLTCLGYAFFAGAAGARIFAFFRNQNFRFNKLAATLSIALIIIVNMIYAYPVTVGKVFVAPEDREFLSPNHAKIPDYVHEFADYVNSNNDYFRILDLPESKYWAYTWGLSSPTPFVTQVALKPILCSTYTKFFGGPADNIIPYCYEMIYEKGYNAAAILNLLNARYVLQENDVRYEIPDGGIDSPQFIKDKLAKQKSISMLKSFGEWNLYKTDAFLPHIYKIKDMQLVAAGYESLIALSKTDLLSYANIIFASEDNDAAIAQLLHDKKISSVIFYNKLAAENEKFYTYIKENNTSFYYFVNTAAMHRQFVPSSESGAVLTMQYKDGFYEDAVFLTDDTEWHLLKQNNQDHLEINNNTEEAIKINLAIKAYSFEIDRNLYIYLNKKLLNFYGIKANIANQIILEGLSLEPGKNIISFAGVSAASIYEGKQATFALAEDIYTGDFKYEQSVDLPKKGDYEIRLYPLTNAYLFEENLVEIMVNGTALQLKKNKKGVPSFSGDITIDNNKCHLGLEQALAWKESLILLSPYSNKPNLTSFSKLEYVRVNPTHYSVTLEQEAEPYFVIFCESFHPEWTGVINNITLQNHFTANAYANCWYIKDAYPAKFDIKYRPQNVFRLSLTISIISFAGISLLLIFFLIKKLFLLIK